MYVYVYVWLYFYENQYHAIFKFQSLLGNMKEKKEEKKDASWTHGMNYASK